MTKGVRNARGEKLCRSCNRYLLPDDVHFGRSRGYLCSPCKRCHAAQVARRNRARHAGMTAEERITEDAAVKAYHLRYRRTHKVQHRDYMRAYQRVKRGENRI